MTIDSPSHSSNTICITSITERYDFDNVRTLVDCLKSAGYGDKSQSLKEVFEFAVTIAGKEDELNVLLLVVKKVEPDPERVQCL